MYKSQPSGVHAPFLPLSLGAARGKESFLPSPSLLPLPHSGPHPVLSVLWQ